MQHDDIKAAVGTGIITESQAASLTALSQSRAGSRSDLVPHDEPFELFKGFNEIFIVVGLVILATGYNMVAVAVNLVFSDIEKLFVSPSYILGAAILWGLSEYFIRKRRMVAPAILLSIFFATNALVFFLGLFYYLLDPVGESAWAVYGCGLSMIAIFVYWRRFRVPFTLAIIAFLSFFTAMFTIATYAGVPDEITSLFFLSASGPFAWSTLALGIIIFAVAMYFDGSDPHRVTRRSANGFWLHIVAAPAITNTIAITLLADGGAVPLALLFIFLAVISLVAITIDRRSFLIASAGYVVALMTTLFEGAGLAWSIFILGFVLILLGAMWERIRARVLNSLPAFIPVSYLPPAHKLETT